jgi:tetratricopeptide (TPR) repeat protein
MAVILLGVTGWIPALSGVAHAGDSPPPLFENLGTLHHPITTGSERAQHYFDQGLRLVYAFNHEEAVRAFEEAARLDPTAAMAYWGIALALGPNINAPMDKRDEPRAREAIQRAKAQGGHVTPAERAYIDALSVRYGAKNGSRTRLDRAYGDAMRALWKQFPDDADAGTLFAEALMDLRPWDLWTPDGRPNPGTEEIVSTLEAVLAAHPDHPGACHYYIHAVEASPSPERALPCAEKLPGLMPGAGHLVHMPAHVYIRLGKYHDAAERNSHAAHVDQDYLTGRALRGEYADSYYSHNLHFLWVSLAMEGRRDEALRAARELVATITEDEARHDKWKAWYRPASLFSMIRFGQWDEVLREPATPKGLRLEEAVWRLGRGLALAATGRLPGAEGEHFALAELVKRFARDRTKEDKIERTLIKIAERLLAGDLAARRKKYDEAVKLYNEAIKIEESLPYNEPPQWPVPVRHFLGAALLKAGQPAAAESAYRADLVRFPNNGWALFGLAQSLRDQAKIQDAEAVEEQFKASWTYADVTLTASRF